jgi:hypothetical protein
MVASISIIQNSFNFLQNQMLFVTVIPKYLNCDTFSNNMFAIFMSDFDLHYGDETATYT